MLSHWSPQVASGFTEIVPHRALTVRQEALCHSQIATSESLSPSIDVTQGCPAPTRSDWLRNRESHPGAGDPMKAKTAVLKRSIFINGQKSSVSLEKEFWEGLQAIAKQKGTTASKLAEHIAQHRTTINLSSAIRIFVFNHVRSLDLAPAADGTSLVAKAVESRALAGNAKNESARAAMLEIAADYEVMAERRKREPEI